MADTFGNSHSTLSSLPGASTEFERSIARSAEPENDAPEGLREAISEDIGSVKRTVEDGARKATDKAAEIAEQQKGYAAEQIEKVASALERVGQELQSEQAGPIGGYTAQLGSSARQFADKVKGKNFSQIAGLVEDFGRRQPLAFLGIATVAGLAASRFMMASPERTFSPEPSQSASQPNSSMEVYNG